MKQVRVLNESNGNEVGDRIGRADSSLTRLVGLLAHRELRAGGGIWICPSSGVHTFGMRFPIDVVGMSRQGCVVRLWRRLAPQRMTGLSLAVHSVLELAAGQIEACGLEVGHQLRVAAADSERCDVRHELMEAAAPLPLPAYAASSSYRAAGLLPLRRDANRKVLVADRS